MRYKARIARNAEYLTIVYNRLVFVLQIVAVKGIIWVASRGSSI